jgi:hypothetical protein
MSEASDPKAKRAAPWRGRPRVPDPKSIAISFRCTASDHAAIHQAAARAGLSAGAYLRKLAVGSTGPRAVRRPAVELRELAWLKGQVNKLGSNVNQFAHAYNRDRVLPGFAEILAIRRDIERMSAALMKALRRDN